MHGSIGVRMKVVDKAAGARRRQRRRAKYLVAAAASVPVLALQAVGTAAAADAPVFDALPPGPARVLTLSLIPGGNDDDLRGVVCEARTCIPVAYPYLERAAGVAELDNALRDGLTDRQIVFGYSQGALVSTDWLEEYSGTAAVVPPSELGFVLFGNPARKYGGSRVALGDLTPATAYKVLDVSRQYDMASDAPDDSFNLLATINAWAGFSSVHPDYEDVDIYDPANYVWKEGNTTYVFVPTERLPILGFLYGVGLTGLADALDAPLRAQIEKAYDRSYLPAEPGMLPAEEELEPGPEEAAEQPEQPQAAAAALLTSRSALIQDENDTARLVPDGADTREESEDNQDQPESEAEGMAVEVDFDGAEADLKEADLKDADPARPGDLDDEALESEADEDQGAVAAAAVSEDEDSAQSSSGTDATSSDSDSSSGGQSPSGSENSSDSEGSSGSQSSSDSDE